MALRQTTPLDDPTELSIMSSPTTAPGASMQWLSGAYPVESMLMPRREYRPFGYDQDEPGPEELA